MPSASTDSPAKHTRCRIDERCRTVEIVAGELAGALPLIIGIAPNSTESAIQQARQFAAYQPAALMTLPPPTMDNGAGALVEFYVALGKATDVPIILQQAPHIPQYRHTELSAEALAEIAERAPNVRYYKLEGPGSAAKMRELKPLLPEDRKMFGGGGGITVLEELRNGAAGLIPGVGFNEIFLAAWATWKRGDAEAAEATILTGAPLDESGVGQGARIFAAHAQATDETLRLNPLRLCCGSRQLNSTNVICPHSLL